ncbi:hypothetical protein E0H75_16260 [Kribbella capetownensis]|uniref:Uncharacterized protein n=1 Tax=Kribbella capetownensis TaxID=1572659 RepID=A0A4R0JTI5_9ACTN|nr:hypothetical protein [Kribbella capetownensis]TCC49867.1 hypothetical protein E0H75_16260 [Kribbella capetownensis]
MSGRPRSRTEHGRTTSTRSPWVDVLRRPATLLVVYLVFLFILYLVTADPYKAVTLPFAAVIGSLGFAVLRWTWTRRIRPFTIGIALRTILLTLPALAAILLAALFVLAAVRA